MNRPNSIAAISMMLALGMQPFRLDDEMQKPPKITLCRTYEDDLAAKEKAEAKRKRKAERLRRIAENQKAR